MTNLQYFMICAPVSSVLSFAILAGGRLVPLKMAAWVCAAGAALYLGYFYFALRALGMADELAFPSWQ